VVAVGGNVGHDHIASSALSGQRHHVTEDRAGSVTSVPLTRRLGGGALSAGTFYPKVVLGPLAGGRGALAE
jgi:hypothetical protein